MNHLQRRLAKDLQTKPSLSRKRRSSTQTSRTHPSFSRSICHSTPKFYTSLSHKYPRLLRCDLLVASHSAELSGLLRIWRFPIGPDQTISALYPILPYRTQHLISPTSKIVFNPSPHPKRRHSQLLVVEPRGIARIYDPLALS